MAWTSPFFLADVGACVLMLVLMVVLPISSVRGFKDEARGRK